MKRITETLSKEVVAAAEGEIVGIVTNAYVDRRLTRVRGYKVCSEDRDEGRLLPLKRVLGEGDAMIVKDGAYLTETTLAPCPMGAKVYDTLGTCHGVLRDLVYDEQSGTVLSLVADDKEIDTGRVVGCGAKAVVLRAPCHDGLLIRRRSATVGRTSHRATVAPVIPAPAALLTVTEVETPEEETEPFYGEYAFLLGRTVLKTIVAEGEVLATESERVTPELIAKAREHGKLVELTVNSRKG